MVKFPKPHLRFHHSEELREKTIDVLDKIEQSEDPKQYRNELGDLVVDLTNAGMEFFFIKPLELAKAGFMTQQSANFGLTAQRRVMSPIIRSVIGGMDNKQLLIICGYLRQLMH